MKLSDWAKKQGISYLTAYRWFKDGKLPIKAYQSDSGTIIVQDESENLDSNMAGSISQPNEAMSTFLKKTVEFSKSNASLEDFAAYILSNFSLKLNSMVNDLPKYSRNKPKPEDVQKHFQKFLKPKGEKPKLAMLIADDDEFDKLAEASESLETQELAQHLSDGTAPTIEVQDLLKDLTAAFATTTGGVISLNNSIKTYSSAGADGIVNRIELTPQLNYTDSSNNTIGDLPIFNLEDVSSKISSTIAASPTLTPAVDARRAFKPTQKELDSVSKAMETVANQLHSQVVKARRGRKPSKKK
jgi:hypothetical protein